MPPAEETTEGQAPPAPKSKYSDPKERARHAALVRWGKDKPMTPQQRLESLRARRKARKGGARKPAKPSAEEQRQARYNEAAAALEDAGAIGQQELGALSEFASGLDLDEKTATALEARGLVERGADGTLRMTAAGNQVLSATERGNVRGALDALSRARDKKQKETRDGLAKELDKAAAPAREKEEKPKGGGGGGGKQKPTADEKRAEQEKERAATAEQTARDVGLDDLDALREAADAGGASSDALMRLGLIDENGDATDQGRRALVALERGNVRQYRAALQDAAQRRRREGERQAREEERERSREQARSRRERRTPRRDRASLLRDAQQRGYRQAAKTEHTTMDDLLTLTDAIDAYVEAFDDTAIKAGRRNSASDQELLDRAYEVALDLCDILEAAGASAGEEEEVETDAAPPTKTLADDAVFVEGSEVKALDGDRVQALAIRFGSEDEPDMSHVRDYFTKATDLWLDAWDRRPMLYHHALDESTQDAPRIGTWTKATVTDEGVWLEGELSKAHRYYGAIKELIKRGALRVSSDSAPHLVLREARRNGTHEVKRWPLLAASLTPTPAEPRLSAVSLKAILAELGDVAIDDSPEAHGDEAQSGDGQKAASDEHARRQSEELELISIMEALWTL